MTHCKHAQAIDDVGHNYGLLLFSGESRLPTPKSRSFEAIELQIEKVSLENGPELAYSTTDKKLIVTLDRVYHHGEVFTIAVQYHAKPRIGLHFIKPVPEDPTRPVQAWTFGQPRYHSHWFPCHDAPNDRATTEIIATVPSQFLTVSNGNLIE